MRVFLSKKLKALILWAAWLFMETVEQPCNLSKNMWTLCYGNDLGQSGQPNSITVDELTRDVFTCGQSIVDTNEKYQEFFVARFDQLGNSLGQFAVGTTGNHQLDACYDLDASEHDHYIFAVGAVQGHSLGTTDMLILRTNPDLSNPVFRHWGGTTTNDAGQAVIINGMGTFVYFVGYTISFSGQNDYDNFLMRTDKNLDMHYLRIIKNGGGHEYLNTIVLRKSDEKLMYMGGRIDYQSYGGAAGEYKGLLMQCNLDNWGWYKTEIGSFDFVGNDNIQQIDLSLDENRLAFCGQAAGMVVFGTIELKPAFPRKESAYGSQTDANQLQAGQAHGCRWIPGKTGDVGTAFVVWGTTWRDQGNDMMTEPKYFFAKIHQDAWPLQFRIIGRNGMASNDLGTSKIYMDSYGIVYMAGKSSTWCQQYGHQPNAWTVFKNNFQMGLFQDDAGTMYNFWNAMSPTDTSSSSIMHDPDAPSTATPPGINFRHGNKLQNIQINQYWHDLENSLEITSPVAMPGYSKVILHSDFQFQNGEHEIIFHTNTYDEQALHKVCNFDNSLQRSVFELDQVQSGPQPQPVLLDKDVQFYEKNEIMYLSTKDLQADQSVSYYKLEVFGGDKNNKASLLKYKIVTPGYLFFSGTLPSITVTGGIVTSFPLEVNNFVNSDRFSIYEIDPAGLAPETGVPAWLHLQMAFNGKYKSKTRQDVNQNADKFFVDKAGPAGDYFIKVSVWDEYQESLNQTFKLTVVNELPASDRPIGTLNAIVDEEFRLYFRDYYTDADEVAGTGQVLSFDLTCGGGTWPAWLYFSRRGYLTGVPQDDLSKTITICTVQVSDGCATVTEEFQIYVNRRPFMIKTFESDFQDSYGKIWVNGTNHFNLDLQSYFADPDGDKLSYSLIRTNGTVVPLWLGMDIENMLTGAPSYYDSEILNLYVNVDDGKGGNLTVPLVLNVNTHPLDTQRLAETIYLTRINSFTYYLRDTFYDPNNDTIHYDLVNAPDWISVIGDEMHAQPRDEGTFKITLRACDSFEYCNTKEFTIIVNPINIKPFVEKGMPDFTVYSHQHFVIKVPDDAFRDINGDPQIMRAKLPATQHEPDGLDLPDWIKFYEGFNYFVGYSEEIQELEIILTTMDASRKSASSIFKIQVISTNNPVPNFQIPEQYEWSGQEWSFTIPLDTFKDKDKQLDRTSDFYYNASLVANQSLPAWLSFSSSNRSFYANNTETGIYEIEIVAVDSQQNKQYMHFALQVFEDSRDTQQFYLGTVYIAIVFCIAMAVLYFIMSFFTFLQVQSTRSVNSASINSLLGQNPFKFTDRKSKQQTSQLQS